ncbi:MAG: P1 family peptidase [Lachnospiraceae bacterium]|nr:P1 family peptidase [Lachnospiraceae bacterium]
MKKRIRDFGYKIGHLPIGERNKITDVPGVQVGHWTRKEGKQNTGITVILPGRDNPFLKKYTASGYVHNGFGKTCGLVQVEELGILETPIALTSTLSVGKTADAVVSYMIEETRKEGQEVYSINPVVGECNDSRINDIQERITGEKELRQAIALADAEFEEGAVGAGTGTICYGLKGGIGSSSRVMEIDGKKYTLGVLVQTNFGSTRDLHVDGRAVGLEIEEKMEKEKTGYSAEDRGSIMTVLATDLPVTDRQLHRIIRRCGVGIARTGAYTGHGSGEIMIGFTTSNRIPAEGEHAVETCLRLKEDLINIAFEAAAEATEEAILNSMTAAEPTKGLDGKWYRSLSEYLEGNVG